MKNILICGLGGGLDVLNCLPLCYKFKNDKNYSEIHLGSIRPAPQSSVKNAIAVYHEQATLLGIDSKVMYKGRYAEPFISSIIGRPIVLFSRMVDDKYSISGLSEAIKLFRDEHSIDEIYFVDGGGDSMTLIPEDIIGASQSKDVFDGGDAFALEALQDIPSTLCVTVVGLDVDRKKFIKRLDELTLDDIYEVMNKKAHYFSCGMNCSDITNLQKYSK